MATQPPGYSHPAPARTKEGIEDDLIAAHEAGDKERAAQFRAELRALTPNAAKGLNYAVNPDAATLKQATEAQRTRHATKAVLSEMNPAQKIAASTGASLNSGIRALGGSSLSRFMGLPDTQEEGDALDNELNKGATGFTGQMIGGVAKSAPSFLVPGAALPQALAGAASSFATTEGGVGDRASAGALGGVLGGGTAAVPGLLGYGKGVAKSITAPYTRSGHNRIIRDAVGTFSDNPNMVNQGQLDQLTALLGRPSSVGSRLSVPERTGDSGLELLKKTIEGIDQQANAAGLATRDFNNSQRIGALEQLAGDSRGWYDTPQAKAAGLDKLPRGTARQEATKALKDKTDPLFAISDTSVMRADTPEWAQMMELPQFQRAVRDADVLSRSKDGTPLFWEDAAGKPIALTGERAHYLKKALQETGKPGSRSYMGQAMERNVQNSVQDFRGLINEQIPEYGMAMLAHAQGMKPINQMDVARRLLDKSQGAQRRGIGGEAGDMGERGLQSQAYARQLNDEASLIANATDDAVRGGELERLMSPEQMKQINAIRAELETANNLAGRANGPGSATAKNMSAQHVLKSLTEPIIGGKWSKKLIDSDVGQTAAQILGLTNKVTGSNQRVTSSVHDALMNPDRLIEALKPTAAEAKKAAIAAKRSTENGAKKAGRNMVKRATPATAAAYGKENAAQNRIEPDDEE